MRRNVATVVLAVTDELHSHSGFNVFTVAPMLGTAHASTQAKA